MKTTPGIAQHIEQHFNLEQIILFGSHAYGKPTGKSDVDVIICSPRTLERRKKLSA